MPITLPKVKKAATSIDPDIIIFYALPKVGKTAMLAQLEDNLILDLEKGTDRYDAMAIQAETYQEFQEVLVALATGYKEKGEVPLYTYGSVDTLGILEDIAIHKAAELYRQTPMGKTWYAKNYDAPGKLKVEGDLISNLPNGAGYGYIREAMKWYITILKKFFKHLILIAHVKDKRLQSLDGGEDVIVKDIALTGRLGSILAAQADAIGYMYRNGKGELIVSFKTNENSIMGSRCPHLAGQQFPFDWSKIFIESKAKVSA